MTVEVRLVDGGYRIGGGWDEAAMANAFLSHLTARAFSAATIRAYAFDVVNLARFLADRRLGLAAVTPMDVFAWVDWQGARRDGEAVSKVVALRRPTAAAGDVDSFMSSLRTHWDRAMVLAMLLGGLRSAEVRSLKLADVDMGGRRIRVLGKGGKERVVPVDSGFFAELAAYLRLERPPGLSTLECFVALRGPTRGAAVSEAGLRNLFRRHRQACGAIRVRPHRLRHTYGTELAAAGIDLLTLRELMGHSSPEHLSIEQLAAEYAAARASIAGAAR